MRSQSAGAGTAAIAELVLHSDALSAHAAQQFISCLRSIVATLASAIRESVALFDTAANLTRAGLNQPPARASTSGAWQDPSAPLPTDICSGGCPAAGARLPSYCLSAMAVFALFRFPFGASS